MWLKIQLVLPKVFFFIVFKHQILRYFPLHHNSQICLQHVGQQPQERFQTR